MKTKGVTYFNSNDLKLKIQINMRGAINLVLIAFTLFQISCVNTQCLVCENSTHRVLNVHLKPESNRDQLEFETYFEPLFSKEGKSVKVHIINCDNISPSILISDTLEPYFQENIIVLDTALIDYFSTSSDIDYPAEKVQFQYSKSKLICNRDRNDFKIEARLMAGMRNTNLSSIYFPGYDGGSVYQKEWFSIGEGGTVLTTGFELSASQKIVSIGNRHAFSLGLMTGFWPIDGGYHIPIGVHPRLTFNNNSSALSGACNAWYVFGDYGTTYNPMGNVPFYDTSFKSSFWDLGIGVDLFQTTKRDFSLDFGYRNTKLAMPINQDLLDCLEEANLPIIDLYPVRAAGQVFVRVGFTF